MIDFKAGDKVVFDNTKQYCASLPNHMMEYVDLHPEWPQDRLVLIDGVLNEVSYRAIRLATPNEIAAGHRIDKSPLLKHLDECAEIVKTWPKWKVESVRNALGIHIREQALKGGLNG